MGGGNRESRPVNFLARKLLFVFLVLMRKRDRMKAPSLLGPRLIAAVMVLLVSGSGALAADEAGLMAIWRRHTESPDDHAGTIAACEAFAKARANDPLVPVAQEIRAWHLLKTGQTEEAGRILEGYLTSQSDNIHRGALQVAKGWLTRLDREQVGKSLKFYYRKEVGYPADLGAISRHPKVPREAHPVLQDRFGDPWQYRLTGIKGLPKFQDQRYELLSLTLGDQSDLETALNSPYAFNIRHEPAQVWADRKPPQVLFKKPGGGAAAALPEGAQSGEFYLAYVGGSMIVVCNHSYWKIFPTP